MSKLLSMLVFAGLSPLVAETHVSDYQKKKVPPASQQLLTLGLLTLGLSALALPLQFQDRKKCVKDAQLRAEDSSFRRTCRNWDPHF